MGQVYVIQISNKATASYIKRVKFVHFSLLFLILMGEVSELADFFAKRLNLVKSPHGVKHFIDLIDKRITEMQKIEKYLDQCIRYFNNQCIECDITIQDHMWEDKENVLNAKKTKIQSGCDLIAVLAAKNMVQNAIRILRLSNVDFERDKITDNSYFVAYGLIFPVFTNVFDIYGSEMHQYFY